MLCGYFGSGNVGDELILDGTVKRLKSEGANIVILTADPWLHRQKYGVHCFYKYDPLSFISYLLGSKEMIFPGGGIFQDITSKRSLYYYILLIVIARLLLVPVKLQNIGLGPFVNYLNRLITFKILDYCSFLSVRDGYSYEMAGKWMKTKAMLSRDTLYEIKDEYTGIPGKKESGIVIGINLRPWHNVKHAVKILGSVLSEFKGDPKYTFLLIPFAPEDEKILNRLRRYVSGNCFLIKFDPENAFNVLSMCDISIGMRLHFNMIAKILGIRGINLSYERKCEHAIKGADSEGTIRIGRLTEKKFRMMLMSVLNSSSTSGSHS